MKHKNFLIAEAMIIAEGLIVWFGGSWIDIIFLPTGFGLGYLLSHLKAEGVI